MAAKSQCLTLFSHGLLNPTSPKTCAKLVPLGKADSLHLPWGLCGYKDVPWQWQMQDPPEIAHLDCARPLAVAMETRRQVLHFLPQKCQVAVAP